MDYQEIVVKSLKIAWGNKWLWIFGLFATGGVSAPNFGSGSFNWGENWGEESSTELQARFSEWAHQYWVLIIGLAIFLFVMIVVFTVLSVIANGALIRAAADIEDEQETSFSQSFKAGAHFFWRLFGLSLLLIAVVGLPLLIIFGTAVWALIAGQTALAILFGILSVLTILALIPLSILLSVLFFFGARAIVLKDQRVVASLRSAWQLIRENLGTSFLLWLIGILLTMAFMAIAFVALLLMAIPVVIAGVIVFYSELTLTGLGIFTFLVLMVLAVLIIFASGFRAFLSTYWTLAFKKLTIPPDEPQEELGSQSVR